jgi:hypothetical protein
MVGHQRRTRIRQEMLATERFQRATCKARNRVLSGWKTSGHGGCRFGGPLEPPSRLLRPGLESGNRSRGSRFRGPGVPAHLSGHLKQWTAGLVGERGRAREVVAVAQVGACGPAAWIRGIGGVRLDAIREARLLAASLAENSLCRLRCLPMVVRGAKKHPLVWVLAALAVWVAANLLVRTVRFIDEQAELKKAQAWLHQAEQELGPGTTREDAIRWLRRNGAEMVWELEKENDKPVEELGFRQISGRQVFGKRSFWTQPIEAELQLHFDGNWRYQQATLTTKPTNR